MPTTVVASCYRISDISVEERLQRLEELDLSPIRLILRQEPPTGFGWSEDTVLQAEKFYRQFLHLNLIQVVQRPVPNTLADAFWHAHILDTRRYRKDCQSVFGYFLDHNPGFGARDDIEERDRAFKETMGASNTLFGQGVWSIHPRAESPSMCGSSFRTPSMCGSSVAIGSAE